VDPFTTHMVQHVVLMDLVPIAIVILFRLRVGPAIGLAAFPVWLANLVFWHVPAVFDAALRHTAIHAVQHLALLGAGILLWSAVIGPSLGTGTRLGIVAAMMLAGIVLSSFLLWWPRVLYVQTASLTDQRVGGGLMLLEGMVVALSVAAWLVLTFLREPAAASASQSP
jgi:putative membrane protein